MPHSIRILGSNISLDRFYYNVDSEKVISELIDLSSPDFGKKIVFLWPEVLFQIHTLAQCLHIKIYLQISLMKII